MADWNRLLEVNRFLMIEESPDDHGASFTRQFSEDWGIQLTVDPGSGEVVLAELTASLNAHTDQLIMRYLSMLTFIQAVNPRLEFEWDDDWVWVRERLGLPDPDGNGPDLFGTGNYQTEGEIEGVIYRLEESDFDTVLTARPVTQP